VYANAIVVPLQRELDREREKCVRERAQRARSLIMKINCIRMNNVNWFFSQWTWPTWRI